MLLDAFCWGSRWVPKILIPQSEIHHFHVPNLSLRLFNLSQGSTILQIHLCHLGRFAELCPSAGKHQAASKDWFFLKKNLATLYQRKMIYVWQLCFLYWNMLLFKSSWDLNSNHGQLWHIWNGLRLKDQSSSDMNDLILTSIALNLAFG